MGTSVLKRVPSIKYLGLMIDERLNWKSHVSYLRSKVSSCCNIMYKLRHLIPLESCIFVYYSLFYSRISYGIMCWGSTYHSITNPIGVLQNKIVKSILFKRQSSDYDDTNYSTLLVIMNIAYDKWQHDLKQY